jgi:hypothetical protein
MVMIFKNFCCNCFTIIILTRLYIGINMSTVEPLLVDELGYVSAGILSIIGLVAGFWTVYHLLTVGVLSLAGFMLAILIIAGVFGFIYGDLWLADVEESTE